MVAFFLGALLGGLAVVQIFKLIAGTNFTTWRQVLAAYLALEIAVVFISAVGDANGGPPNFSSAPVRVFATGICFRN